VRSMFWTSIFGWLAVACFAGWQEDRLRQLTAERDRLAVRLAGREECFYQLRFSLDEIRGLRARVRELDGAPVRGPYPDGQSSEKYDPPPVPVRAFGFGVRGNGVWAVTGDPPACAAGPLVRGLPSPPTAGEVPRP
jgi:hypothetical protein